MQNHARLKDTIKITKLSLFTSIFLKSIFIIGKLINLHVTYNESKPIQDEMNL